MRAILVCVDYADILAVTLPWNRHHFSDVMVVTAGRDYETLKTAERYGAGVFRTDAFWEGGAAFNKFKALELGLDAFGREGWLCLMDADVMWPRGLSVHPAGDLLCLDGVGGLSLTLKPGQLCSPLRRMWTSFPHNPLPIRYTDQLLQLMGPAVDGKGNPLAEGLVDHVRLPAEGHWGEFPVHRNVGEWAGYSQIFHADDPVLRLCGNCGISRPYHSLDGTCPSGKARFGWHQTDWRHAGGADSFFQARWPRERRVRPPWECLHLGPAGANWMGRASPLVDGSLPEGATERAAELRAVWASRGEARRRPGSDPFPGERLGR